MSEYIEDRVKKLETRTSSQAIDITAQQFSIKELKERVKALEEKSGLTVEDHIDQSTEEFVRVVRCGKCAWRNSLKNWCMNRKGLNREVLLDEHCSEGKME